MSATVGRAMAMESPVPRRARSLEERPRGQPATRPETSPVSPDSTAIAYCGLRIFATWSKWIGAGSIASVLWRAIPGRLWPGWSRRIRTSRRCQLLFAALSEYGCPQALVSDNGSVFTAKDYLAILRDLEIEPLHIETGNPWQNLIEAQFKVQLRLADSNLGRRTP